MVFNNCQDFARAINSQFQIMPQLPKPPKKAPVIYAKNGAATNCEFHFDKEISWYENRYWFMGPPIVNALAWLQGTLLGSVATAVAVMAVAAVGFMMLTGRMNWRFGATVIIGVFILFGAGAIVSGIQQAAVG